MSSAPTAGPPEASDPHEVLEPAMEAADEAREVEVLAVTVAGAHFGLPIGRVTSVLKMPALTRVPFPPPSIVGVASVRGTLVPILDLGERLLGVPASREGCVVLVSDTAMNQQMGVLVDDVIGLVKGTPEEGDLVPEIEASLPGGWVAGLLAAGPERLITLLELEPVLAVGAATDKEQR